MRKLAAFALVVVVGACHKADRAGEAGGAAGPSAPTSTAEQDALWALAPDGATMGLVISPRGVAEVERGWLAVQALLDTAPDLASWKAKVHGHLQAVTGMAAPTLADLGLSHDKGFAGFTVESGGEVMIVPVDDRAKLVAVTKGTSGDRDTIAGYTCGMVGSVYACAKPAELLARIGKGNMKAAIAPAGARGDIELAATFPVAPGKTVGIADVVQLAAGAVTLRGTITGVPTQYASKLGALRTPTIDPDKVSGFAVMDLSGLIPMVPALSLMPGVTAAEVAQAFAGPVDVSVGAGELMIELRAPLKNSAPVAALVAQCAALPPLASLGATVKDGACTVPLSMFGSSIDVWIENNELRVGRRGAKVEPATVPLVGAGRELATQAWSFAMYGRGSLLGLAKFPGMPDTTNVADEPSFALGVHAMAALNELGFGVRVDGDAIKLVATVRTVWSNPDEVIAKINAISALQILHGEGTAAAKAIADAAPSSPFAADLRAGYTGIVIPTTLVGVLAAVAIPAFIDYTKKSKTSVAALMLNKLGKNAKAYWITNASFPVGNAPLTPATPCCKGPNATCAPDAAAWQQGVWATLDFAIDEPIAYQFSYDSADGKTFVAKAVGDLDCDGVAATYELYGTLDADGNPKVELVSPPSGSY